MAGGTSPEADEQLVARVRNGDLRAFEELYRSHLASVRSVVSGQIRGGEAVADVVQDTFLRALERLDTLRQADHFRPWLLAIARHAAIDHRRRRKLVDSDELPDDRPLPGNGPDELAELAELGRLVKGIVAGLSQRDATAISMVTNLGFRPAEVAAAFEVTPGAAKVIVHRARRRFRDALALQLMVRRRGSGCAGFAALFDADQMEAAARHVHDCETCTGLAARDIELFQAKASFIEAHHSHA